jgi:translocator protein
MYMNKILKLVTSIIVPFIAAAIGNLATIPSIPTWYATLEKPFFSPPNWVFGPVWTVLHLLMGISLYMLWTQSSKKDKTKAFVTFGAQLILNTLWSIVFFGLHSPIGGVVVILVLLMVIIVTMRYFWHFSKPATYLLVPYILWVSFATVLNISIALLN